jgi:hypothetical protein
MKLQQALYFYLFLIVLFTILGMKQFENDLLRGFVNGLTIGIGLSLFLYNVYRKELN